MSEYTVDVTSGGRLITNASSENVGRANYVEKTNWRRIDDAEVSREGTLLFRPNTGLPQGSQHLNAGSDVVGLWQATRPNGERAVVAATRTTLYRYAYSTGTWTTIGSGYSTNATYWEGESLDGYLILNNGVDLPCTYRVEDATVEPIYEMRMNGIASVRTIAVHNGFLLCGDVSEFANSELATVMNSPSPWGTYPASDSNRIRYKIVWSDLGKPRNWAIVVQGTIQSADKDIIELDFPVPEWVVGTKLGVDGAGAGGGMLGGQVGYEDGVTITNVSSTDITINTEANAGLTYPLTVNVMLWVDTSTFSGAASIQDDSSAIIKLKPLERFLAVYRETGIFHGFFTGQQVVTGADTQGVSGEPFIFKPQYQGRNVPAFSQAVVDLDGKAHIYPTRNTFYIYDGSGDPSIFPLLDAARNQFFTGLVPSNAYKVFAAHNPITKELWFNSPLGVLCYDYVGKSVSWINESYGAFAFIRKPDGTDSTLPSEDWVILGRAAAVVQYGKTDTGVEVYTRLGASYDAVLKFGLIDGPSQYHEKDLVNYVPLLASSSPRLPVEVTLYGTDNSVYSADLLDGFPLTIVDPGVNNAVECYFRNIFFQDKLKVTVNGNKVKFAARIFEINPIKTRSITRTNGGS